MNKTLASSITYYDWEGSACRLHLYANGRMTADVYRAGQGIVEISHADILSCATRISEAAYKLLVMEEMANKSEGYD